MKPKRLPSTETLRALFKYDAKTGKLFWWPKLRNGVVRNKRFAGKEAGTYQPNEKYVIVSINKEAFLAHRIIYKMHHGQEPSHIDHINQNKRDNRIENLRPATKSQNNVNGRARVNNTTGVVGVSLDRRGFYHAYLGKDGKRVFSKCFETLEDAKSARIAAEIKHYGRYSPNASVLSHERSGS